MREPKNCTARRDLYSHSDQRWEMNSAFSSRPEDQMRLYPSPAGGEGYSPWDKYPIQPKECPGCIPNTFNS